MSLTPPPLRSGSVPAEAFSHGGHGGSEAAPPTPPSKSAFPVSCVRSGWGTSYSVEKSPRRQEESRTRRPACLGSQAHGARPCRLRRTCRGTPSLHSPDAARPPGAARRARCEARRAHRRQARTLPRAPHPLDGHPRHRSRHRSDDRRRVGNGHDRLQELRAPSRLDGRLPGNIEAPESASSVPRARATST